MEEKKMASTTKDLIKEEN